MELVLKTLHHFFKKFVVVALLFAFTTTNSGTNFLYSLAAPSAFQNRYGPLLSLKEKKHRIKAFATLPSLKTPNEFILLSSQIFVAAENPEMKANAKQLLDWLRNKKSLKKEEREALSERFSSFLKKLAQEKTQQSVTLFSKFKKIFTLKTNLILWVSTLTLFSSTLFTLIQVHRLKNKLSQTEEKHLEEKSALEQSVEQLQNQLTEMTRSKNTLEKEHEEMPKKLKELEAATGKADEKESELKQKIDELNQALEKEKQKLVSEQTKIEELKQEKDKLFKEYRAALEEGNKQHEEYNSFFKKSTELFKENFELKQKLREIENKLRELQRKTTLLPSELEQIYFNSKFVSNTDELGFEEKWSIASAVQQILKRAGKNITDATIDSVLPFILQERKESANRILMDENSHLILIMNDDKKMFVPDRIISFAKERGVKEENIQVFVGAKDKTKALEAIESAPLGTTLWFDGHGGRDHFWLAGGEIGNEKSTDLGQSDAISCEELAFALSARQDAQKGKLNDLAIINHSCFSANQADKVLETLLSAQNEAAKKIASKKQYLTSKENNVRQQAEFEINRYQFQAVREAPLMIAATNRDNYGLNLHFLKGLNKAVKLNEKLTVRSIYQAEAYIIFSLPPHLKNPSGDEMKFQDPMIRVPISEELLQKIEKALNVKELQDRSPTLEIGALDKKHDFKILHNLNNFNILLDEAK